MDLLICLDEAHARRIEGPDYDGPEDEPIWALYTVTTDDNGEWIRRLVAEGVTVAQARKLADKPKYRGLRFID